MFFVNVLILRNLSQICVSLIFTIQKYIILKNENDKSIKHENFLHPPPLLNTPLLVTHQKGYLYELALIEILLSAKHRNPHSNSLRHNSSDDSMLVTSPLIHFLLPRVAIQPLLQA